MDNQSVKIILPLPPKVLSPNWTAGSLGTRFAKAAAIKRQKRLAKEEVERCILEDLPWKKVDVNVTFFHKVKRKRDEDNAMRSVKAAYDGFVVAGLVEDDDWEHMSRKIPKFEVDKNYPRVEFLLERVE